jgi:PAS domain S-box-containing protein
MSELEAIGGEVEDAIERVRVPAYVIDRHGIIRYLNPAARKLVGDVRGRQLTSVVAPEETRRAREIFARNLMGPRAGSDNKGVVIDADGERVSIEVSAVPLQSGGQVIGVFGQLLDVEEDDPPPPPHPRLTPRQAEVLRLLERGPQRPFAPRGGRGRAARAPRRELTPRRARPPLVIVTVTPPPAHRAGNQSSGRRGRAQHELKCIPGDWRLYAVRALVANQARAW